jgi:hypothetical protein
VSNQANRLTPDGQKLLQKIRKLCSTMQEVILRVNIAKLILLQYSS